MASITKVSRKNKGAVWRINYRDPDGKQIKKVFEKKSEAESYLAKVISARHEGRYHDIFDVKKKNSATFDELAEKYVENFKNQKSFQGFKSHVIKLLQVEFTGKKLASISFLDLETFKNRRKNTPTKNGKTRTDATVNREMAILGHMLSKAVEWEMLEKHPFNKGKSKALKFKENNKRQRFLTDEEIDSLLKACVPHLRPIVETAILTGMRRGELLSLKWEQIRNRLIYLTETKANKDRQIPINDRLAEIFKELRRKNQLKSPYIFCGPDGKPFTEVKRSFATACRKAGITDLRFHDLRHTFASHLVMNGVSLKAVQELLGHADIKMTMRYAHLSQSHLKDAVSTLNSLGSGNILGTFPSPKEKADNPSIANLL